MPDSASPDTAMPDSAVVSDAAGVDAGWNLPGWTRRREIVLAQDTALLAAGFPLLLRLSPERIDYTATASGGADLAFVDPATGVLLDHEIDSWNSSGESLVWVKIPTLDGLAGEVVAVMYHGNSSISIGHDSTPVWSEGYGGVWHFNGDEEDATANANHCLNSGVDGLDAILGKGVRVEPGQYLCCGNDPSLFDASAMTVEAWVRPHSIQGNFDPIAVQGDQTYGLKFVSSGKLLFAIFYGGGWDAVGSDLAPATGTWVHAAGVLRGGQVLLYVDGVLQVDQEASPGMSASNDPFCIGHNSDYPARELMADLDELRISTVARSGSWLAAQHAAALDLLVTVGPEQRLP